MHEMANFPIMIMAILVALTVHEWAHAFMAKRLGDDTAESQGRLTLNPLAHLDPVGAILFLLVGFGWAKPVPVDVRNFRHPVRDAAIVAVAGPLSNLILAFLAVAVGQFMFVDVGDATTTLDTLVLILSRFLAYSLQVNLALMAFNLIPIPPLDGSNILRLFLPWRLRERYEDLMQYGMWVLLAVILLESFLNVPILSGWVNLVSGAVVAVFALVFGA